MYQLNYQKSMYIKNDYKAVVVRYPLFILISAFHSLPADLVDSLDLLEELVDEVLSRLVPLPVVMA